MPRGAGLQITGSGALSAGRFLNRVSNRAVQLRKQYHSVRRPRVAKKLRRVPA